VIDVKTGQIKKSASLNKRAEDSYTYLSAVSGDEEILPYEVDNFPREMREPKNAEELAEALVEALAEDFAKQLFGQFMAK
jgi:hypothetical protein